MMDRDLVRGALRDLEATKSKLVSLLAMLDAAQRGVKPAPVKKENGRLTDAGISKLRIMIDAQRTDTEIANDLGVTSAAIRSHRLKYLTEKMASKRKSEAGRNAQK